MSEHECLLFIQNRPPRSRRTKTVSAPATTAGEAIERMLVERKISTKINYDVLRDLAKGTSAGAAASNPSFPLGDVPYPLTATVASNESSLTISKSPPKCGRLPSLTTRKRTFSGLSSGLPPAK